MRKMLIYVDASVIGGCEDAEFAADSQALWQAFVEGTHTLVLSDLTLRELRVAPPLVCERLKQVPKSNQVLLAESAEVSALAEEYLRRRILGPGSRSDALHVALATVGRVDVLVSWNFQHMVNLGRIRLFNSANVELGYGIVEIRTPKEVLEYE
jgi:hypothetical protein